MKKTPMNIRFLLAFFAKCHFSKNIHNICCKLDILTFPHKMLKPHSNEVSYLDNLWWMVITHPQPSIHGHPSTLHISTLHLPYIHPLYIIHASQSFFLYVIYISLLYATFISNMVTFCVDCMMLFPFVCLIFMLFNNIISLAYMCLRKCAIFYINSLLTCHRPQKVSTQIHQHKSIHTPASMQKVSTVKCII